VTTEGLGTGTADFGSTMLQLEILFIALQIRFFLPTDSKKNQALLLVGLFAITALTVKLSNFAFSLSTITIAAYCFVFTGPFKSRRVMGAVRFVLPLALIALVWTIRGYLLSGVPAYPSTVFRIPTDWAVPADMIRLEAQWAYSWARAPFQYPDLVLGNWKWFRPWLAAIEGKTVDFVYPMVFSLLVFLLTIAMRAWAYWRKRQFPPGWEFSILIPIAAGWVFWFMTAPNLRFANALIFLLQIGMVLICLSHVQALAPRGMAAAVCALFLAMNLPLVRSLQRNPLLLTSISTTGFQQMGTEQLDRMQTRSGLMLYTPVNTDACWDSPLPCTPYFNPGLKLRGSDLKSGFAVTESNWILLHPVLPSTPH
jgi:hypothetical protein